jgi:hypothetical protein
MTPPQMVQTGFVLLVDITSKNQMIDQNPNVIIVRKKMRQMVAAKANFIVNVDGLPVADFAIPHLL